MCYVICKIKFIKLFFGIILFYLFLINKINVKICDIFIILIYFVFEFFYKKLINNYIFFNLI